MTIERIIVGMLQANCYLIGDRDSMMAILVDPGDEPDRLIDIIKDFGFAVSEIVCTHGHFDHVGAVGDLKTALGAKVLLHKDDLLVYKHSYKIAQEWGFDAIAQPEPDLLIEEGYKIHLGNQTIEIIHTPGHSPGSVCLVGGDFVITGDTLFAGSVGRTDFPGGDYQKLGDSFRRLMALDKSTKVLPGHGPSSTIGYERSFNPFSKEFL